MRVFVDGVHILFEERNDFLLGHVRGALHIVYLSRGAGGVGMLLVVVFLLETVLGAMPFLLAVEALVVLHEFSLLRLGDVGGVTMESAVASETSPAAHAAYL